MRQSINSLSPKFLFAFYNNASPDTKVILRPFIDKRLGFISSRDLQVIDNECVVKLDGKEPLTQQNSRTTIL